MHIFKTNIDLDKNEANNFRFQNEIAFPTLTGADTGFTFFHSGIGTFYGWDGTSWLDLAAAGTGGGGASTFLDLTDTPSDYTAQANKSIRVNQAETGVEFYNSLIVGVDEGSGIGYFRSDTDRTKFAPIGEGSIDFGSVFGTDTDYGAACSGGFNVGTDNKLLDNGFGSHVTIGYGNNVGGYYNNIAIGVYNILSQGYSNIVAGYSNTANTDSLTPCSVVLGTHNNQLGYLGVTLGAALYNSAKGTTVVGMANTEYVDAITSPTRPAFIVGIGDMSLGAGDYGTANFRKDGLIVRFNGEITAPNTTIAIIDAESTGKQLVTKEWVSGKIPDYKVYRARLIQSGTSAPTADVFENTLSGTVVWTRTTTGDYSGTLAGEFPQDKTFVLITRAGSTGVLSAWQPDALVDDSVRIISQNFSGSGADSWSGYIEILVYP